MSHFSVLVIGVKPEKQLAPFDENLEFPRYVKYTKEQLIAKGRQEIEDYKNGLYAEYLADPKKYVSDCTNLKHLEYLKTGFPKKLKWTDKQVYADQIRWYEKEDIGKDGEVYSTANPQSKWDWYQLGGRYTGLLKLKEGSIGITGDPGLMTEPAISGFVDQAHKSDIDFEGMSKEKYDHFSKVYDEFLVKWDNGKGECHPYFDFGVENISKDQDNFVPETKEEYVKNRSKFRTFAVIKDGKWYERGEMGWWACVSNKKDKDVWDKEFDNLIQNLPDDTLLSIFDCHI